MLRRRVIDRDLLARRDLAQREEEHVAARHAAEAIRRAGVIDERRRVSAATRIDAPFVVDLANPHLAAFRDATLRFAIRNAFADQLAYLAPRGQRPGCETALAVDTGAFDDEMR